MKKIVFTIISMLAVTLLIGCKDKEVNKKPPDSSAKLMVPSVIGEVLEVKESGTAILVDSIAENVKGLIWVSINDKTNFFENINEGTSIPYHNVSRKFAIGNYVEILIEGGIAESYPMQGLATAVYVNEA